MDIILTIPEDRKRQPVGLMCILMGLTALMLLHTPPHFGNAVEATASASPIVVALNY